ncbi:hypothetical protein ARAM_000335 [Aspergillus rambellii]|uniref:Rhodopsin domain-containing protein n=1 Tax=Aspergillus rambellii TaxID=308745 RepID=A0A0F8UM98_9EURO|nr:hypothetical protein ARAM_000335 [Aspergillus rambellii]
MIVAMMSALGLSHDTGGHVLESYYPYDYRDSARPTDILTQTLGLIGYAVITLEADRHGNGVHQATVAPSDLQVFAKLANASQITYAPLIFITKLSIFLLYLRVFAPSRQGKTYWAIHLLIWFNLLFYLANFFLKIFECIPRAKIWDRKIPGHCININIPILVTSIINVVSDLLMLFLPIFCVWRLKMTKKKKLGISAIFAAGIFGCLSSIMRLVVSVRNSSTQDKTHDWYPEFLWTAAEVTCGILASCLPAIPTFFRHFFHKAKTLFSDMSTRGSSQPRSWEKPREMYSLSRGGRKRQVGVTDDLILTEPVNDFGHGPDDDQTQIFRGPAYTKSEARVEGSRSPMERDLHEGPRMEDGNHQGILKIVEVDVESGPGQRS